MTEKNEKTQQEDVQEYELPETTYIRDVESRVFQAIALQCLSRIEGISFLGGTLIDNLLGRDGMDRIKGVYVEQDQKKHSVYVRVEVNIKYGISIPQKAEEIQSKIVKEISSFTGLHVSCVHVVFKNLIIYQKHQEEEKKEEVAVIADESNQNDLGDGY